MEIVGVYTTAPQRVLLQDGDVVVWVWTAAESAAFEFGGEAAWGWTLRLNGVAATAVLRNIDSCGASSLQAGRAFLVANQLQVATGLYEISFSDPPHGFVAPTVVWFAVVRGVAAVGDVTASGAWLGASWLSSGYAPDARVITAAEYGQAELLGLVCGRPAPSFGGVPVAAFGDHAVAWTPAPRAELALAASHGAAWPTSTGDFGYLLLFGPQGTGRQEKPVATFPERPPSGSPLVPPIGGNPPTTAVNQAPTDALETPPTPGAPDAAAHTFLLVRIAAETVGDGARAVSSVTHHGQALVRIGQRLDPSALELVEIWGRVAPDAGSHPVQVRFSGLVAGAVVAAQVLWNVEPLAPVAGFLAAAGVNSPHTLRFAASAYHTLYGVIAGDGAQNLAPDPTGQPLLQAEYDLAAPDGSQPAYPATLRGAGALVTGTVGGSFSFASGARVWALGVVALAPAGLPSDLPPFVAPDPAPDTPGPPPSTDPTADPNAGDEAPATPACLVQGCTFVGSTHAALHGVVVNRLLITGNAFTDAAAQAVLLDRCDAAQVGGNLFSEGQGTAIVVGAAWRVTVQDNHVQDAALSGSAGAYGIELSNCRHALVQGNRVVGRAQRPQYAVHVDSYCESVAVVDNDFRDGYRVGPVGDTGYLTYCARNLPEPPLAEQVQAIVGAMVTDTATIAAAYDAAAGLLALSVTPRTVDADQVDGRHAAELLDKATYDADDDGRVERAASADHVPWMGIVDRPASYPPERHAHALADLADVAAPAPAEGQVLRYDAGAAVWRPGAAAAVARLDDLLDVMAPAPQAEQLLAYVDGAWRAVTVGDAHLRDEAGALLVDDAGVALAAAVDVFSWPGGATKYAAAVGNGVDSVFTVVHGLGTRDVAVTIYDVGSSVVVFPEVRHTDADRVAVAFAAPPAVGQYRVVVVG